MQRFFTAATGLDVDTLEVLVDRLVASESARGRPWSCSLRRRTIIVCVALRTNLTIRELAAIFAISKSQVHRILGDLVPRLAALLTMNHDRRLSWVVDGTLIPTRDHAVAAKSKNYRWSCNMQVLARQRDLQIVCVAGGGPGNRNDVVHYRGSDVEALCRDHGRVLADGGYRGVSELVTPRFQGRRILRNANWRRHRRRRARVEHAIARLKDWRVLRDHRRRGRHLIDTVRAVVLLHNARIELRDNS